MFDARTESYSLCFIKHSPICKPLITQQHDDRIQERPDPQLVTTVLYCNSSWGFYNKYTKYIHHLKHFVLNITD